MAFSLCILNPVQQTAHLCSLVWYCWTSTCYVHFLVQRPEVIDVFDLKDWVIIPGVPPCLRLRSLCGSVHLIREKKNSTQHALYAWMVTKQVSHIAITSKILTRRAQRSFWCYIVTNRSLCLLFSVISNPKDGIKKGQKHNFSFDFSYWSHNVSTFMY